LLGGLKTTDSRRLRILLAQMLLFGVDHRAAEL
jgi:hypothetical protein